jgi:hypothetical protein
LPDLCAPVGPARRKQTSVRAERERRHRAAVRAKASELHTVRAPEELNVSVTTPGCEDSCVWTERERRHRIPANNQVRGPHRRSADHDHSEAVGSGEEASRANGKDLRPS